jgi:putative oxidoreductase
LKFLKPVSITKGRSDMDIGLLLARAVFGLLMAAHGTQKLFGWLGGYGLAGTGGFFETLGFRPGRAFAAAAGLTELAGGLLLAAGLLAPLGSTMIIAVMVVAAVTVHLSGGLFATTNGVEVPLLYGIAAAALALTGPGAYSLDAALGLTDLWSAQTGWIAIGLGVAGGLANLGLRRSIERAAAAA